MRLLRSALFLFLTWFSVSHLCGAAEMEEMQSITAAAQDAFAHDRFAELSDLAERYRVGRNRTGGGLWKLSAFYAGIDQSVGRAMPRNNIDAAFVSMDARMQRWIKLQPRSPVARLAYAHVLERYAYAVCVCGMTGQITPAARAPFDARIEKMRLYLEQTRSVAEVDPHWYELMLEIAAKQAWDEKRFSATFDAAIAREPLYYQTWFAALDYFLPKWNGNVKDVELFAQAAILKTAATEGIGMYARIYWYASQSQFGDDIFEDSLAHWPTMKKGFDDVMARYPDDWNYQNYGKFACLAHDKKTAAAFFAKVGSGMLPKAWDAPAMFDQCRQWAKSGAI